MSLPLDEQVPDRPVLVYVAAGSNVEPFASLITALEALAARHPDLRVSPAYQNAAVGFEGADFINLAVGFTTRLSLAALLRELHAVEALCGRGRDEPKWAKRRMDLDVLLYGELSGEFPGARLPRPDLVRRAFMLRPLADIAPDAVHPTLGVPIAELWSRFDKASHAMQRVPLGWPAPRP